MPTLDISMFNTDELKLTLFYGLIRQSKTSQFATHALNLSQYKEVLTAIKRGYIDRYNGFVFKSDISGNEFDTFLYNRDNGEGAAERIVKQIITELKLQ
jgi:hypothetical protein